MIALDIVRIMETKFTGFPLCAVISEKQTYFNYRFRFNLYTLISV